MSDQQFSVLKIKAEDEKKVDDLLKAVADLVKPKLAELCAPGITLFWNKLYSAASRRSNLAQAVEAELKQLRESNKNATKTDPAATSDDQLIDEAFSLAEQIEEMSHEVEWPDAAEVVKKSESIADTIEKEQKVSDGQIKALRNMHAAMSKWMPRD